MRLERTREGESESKGNHEHGNNVDDKNISSTHPSKRIHAYDIRLEKGVRRQPAFEM